jgi:phosphoribosylformylglycinamidine synthase
LGLGKNRLGASALAQVYKQLGTETPDVENASQLKGFFDAIQFLNRKGFLLAYHDKSDGGLFVTIAEMAFAGHTGVTVEIGDLGVDDLAVLFNEEAGAVLQIRAAHKEDVLNILSGHGLAHCIHTVGVLNSDGRLIFRRAGSDIINEPVSFFRSVWAETTYRMQAYRDNPDCARSEFEAKSDDGDPGLNVRLTFDIREDVAAPYISRGVAPKIAILREEGVNSQNEMAASFDRAGFESVDVHMSDIISGRVSLKDFKALAACGGFSYGDVLGAGEGWAKSILFNPTARTEFQSFFERSDTLALGVCNGCQMMSNLRDIIPGADLWPRFVRNESDRFEARFSLVEIQKSPSLFFADMAGSRMPIAVAHAEGRTEYLNQEHLKQVQESGLVAVRFVDNCGAVTERYPYNPNGSPFGITGLTSRDGRVTIMMPHPERTIRTVSNSWHPDEWGEDSPWMRAFRNARKALG